MIIQTKEPLSKPVNAVILGDYCKVELYYNQRQVQVERTNEENSITVLETVYEYDYNSFSFNINDESFTLEDIEADPEKFSGFEGNVSYQKRKTLEVIQKWNDVETNKKAVLDSPLGFPVEYSPKALSLLQGVMLMMMGGMLQETSWTDANDLKHDHLNLDAVKSIGAVFAGHVMKIQETADKAREAVRESLNSVDLKEIAKRFK